MPLSLGMSDVAYQSVKCFGTTCQRRLEQSDVRSNLPYSVVLLQFVQSFVLGKHPGHSVIGIRDQSAPPPCPGTCIAMCNESQV